MPLDNNLKKQVEEYLLKLVNPIEITLKMNNSHVSNEMKGFVEELSNLSHKITMRYHEESSHRAPSFTISKVGESTGLTFAGIPLGHEFNSLILALLQVSGYPPKIDEKSISRIKSIQEKLHFETYISLSCHNCPDVVQALNMMAVLNPNISHTMIDGKIFQSEVESKDILSVPTIYLNGEFFESGRIELEEILNKLK